MGIGNTNPSTALQVAGTVTATNFAGNGSGLTGIAGDNLGNHSASQPLYLNNQPLVSAGGSNFDFIRHNDATNTWNFGSDRADVNNTTSGGGSIATGNIELSGRNIYMGSGTQRIYGDDNTAMYIDSDNPTVTQLIMRDQDDTQHGRLYGTGNGAEFGLMDGDTHWGIRMIKDVATTFNINNIERARLLANGNFGLGTSTPSSKLTVVADGATARFARNGTQMTEFINNSGGAEIQSLSPTSNAKGLTLDSTNPSNAAPTGGSNYVRIAVRGSEAVRIEDGGNVGVGTTSPLGKVHIVSGATPNLLLAGGTSDLSVPNGEVLQVGHFNTSTSAFTERMRIATNGNIGIGTSSPADRLQVNGTVRANRFTDANNTGYYVDPASQSQMNDVRGNIFYDRANTAYYANPASESRFNALRMNGNLRRAAPNVGHLEGSYNNVGANSTQTNPIFTIGSNYNPAATTLSNMYGIGFTDGNAASFVTGGGSGWGMYVASDGDARTFLSGGSGGESYINKNGGNVGINTDNPGRQLDVNGIVRATSFQGNGANLTALNASNISSGTLNLARIANNSIPANKLAANSVSTSELAANAVGAGQIAAGAVRASEIQNGSIVATTELSAGGTKNSSTFLRGDNVWATVPAVNAIRDGTPGNWEVASNSNDDIYTSAALEVRELNNGGAQSGSNAQAPRIAFHWGGRAATQIGMGSAGVVRTFDNPGTGYAPFAAAGITANGNLSSTGNIYAGGTEYFGDGKRVIRFNDSWLRLNPSNEFTNGIYAGTLPLRTDGELQAGNNGGRFVVKTNGNVGIGTTSPGQKLDVAGNIRMSAGRSLQFGNGVQRIYGDNSTAFYADSNNAGNVQMIFRDIDDTTFGRVYGSGNGSDFGLLDGDGNWGVHMAKDSYTRFLINNDEKMRILTNGNVGIGSTSPSAKLTVVANGTTARFARDGTQMTEFINDSGGAEIQSLSPTSNAKGLTLDSTNPANAAPSAGSNFVRINVRGTEALRVEDGGNVGIGTSNPAQKLDVAGNADFDTGGDYTSLGIGSESYDRFYADNTASKSRGGGMWIRVGNAAGTGYSDTLRLAENGSVGINVNPSASYKLDVGGTVNATAFRGNGANLTTLNASNITSGTLNLARIANNSIPANKLAPNSVSTSELAANAVGAGQIAAGAVRASEIQNGSIVATTELSAGGTKNSSTFLRGDNVWATVPAVNAIRDGTPGNWEVASNSNSSAYGSAALEVKELNNGGAQSGVSAQAPRIAFHWSGRVASQIGMGTDGVIRTFNNPGTDYADFRANNITAGDRLTLSTAAASYIEGTRVGTTDTINVVANDQIQLSTGSNVARLRINGNGNVGIGTISPGQKLDVAGNINVTGAITSPEGTLRDDNGGWVRTYGNTGWYNGTYGGGWSMQDTTWLRSYGNKNILTGGNVRAARYEDNDNSGYYADPASTSQFNGLDVNSYIRHRGDTNTHIGFPANDTIRLRTAGVDRLHVTSSGSVGIGDSTPEAGLMLDVAGKVGATEYCDANGNKCFSPGGGADNVRLALLDSINYTNNTKSNTRNSWNALVNQVDINGGSEVQNSDWKENCTWNTNEMVPTSSAAYASGHVSVRERLDWCGRIMCRWATDIAGVGTMVDVGARGTSAPYTYGLHCVIAN